MQPIYSFAPVYDSRARVLILGSMPSVKSLAEGYYYAHPRNAFWPVIYGLYDQIPPEDYRERYQFLKDHGLALWDVAASCTREGSADDQIRDVVPNAVGELMAQCPHLEAVALNGGKAQQLFRRMIYPGLPASVQVIALPSTSPAYTLPVAAKLARWRDALAPWLDL